MLNIVKRRQSAVKTKSSLVQHKTFVLQMQTPNFVPRVFAEYNIDECVNMLVYGMTVAKITKKGSGAPHEVFFYMFEDDFTQLQWVSNSKPLRDTRIDLKSVTSISEISTFTKKKSIAKYRQNLLLSIHYNGHEEMLLLFNEEETKKKWWCGLQYFVQKAQAEHSIIKETSNALAIEIFARADADGNKSVDKNEIKKIFKDLQIYVKNKQITDIFNKYDNNKNGTIDLDEFKILVKELLRKEELAPIFKKYAPDWSGRDYSEPIMTLNDLMRFFEQEQKQTLNINEIRSFNESFAEVLQTKPCISCDLFNDIIFSLMNTIFKPEFSFEYQDMNQPLTDYYINSSHNTYLMANQLTGESSVHAYVNALLKGCRCVELDLWNGNNSEPIIYHGHTMTSKILFKDVVIALKEHAFSQSPYPLILSFEMHCDLRGQQRIKDILLEVIGDMIYVIPKDHEKYSYYPSPASLMKKFIIKGKGKLMKNSPLDKILSSSDNPADNNGENAIIVAQTMNDNDGNFSDLNSSQDSQVEDGSNMPPEKSYDENVENEAVNIKMDEEIENQEVNQTFAKTKNTNIQSDAFFPGQTLFKMQKNLSTENQNEATATDSADLKSKQKAGLTNSKKNMDQIMVFDSLDVIEDRSVVKKMERLPSNLYFAVRPGDFNSPRSPIEIPEKIGHGNNEYEDENNENNENNEDNDNPDNNNNKYDDNKLTIKVEHTLEGSASNIRVRSGLSLITPPKQRPKKLTKVLPALNTLYAMIGSKINFNYKRNIWEIASINENKIAKLYKNYHRPLIDFHKRHFTRIYPTASRIDSSNFDPIVGWASGSQLVALNFQTFDEAMLLNYAKFVGNGGVGFILKPRYLRHNILVDDDLACYPKDMRKPIKKLTIRIISGQQIRPDNYKSKEIIDPYVEIKIRGLEQDEQKNSAYRTQMIKDNGFHPVWSTKEGQNVFEFKVAAPDFSVLVFNVYDEDIVGRDKIGWYAIEFKNIQTGYRVVPILNNKLKAIKHSYIFCHVSLSNM